MIGYPRDDRALRSLVVRARRPATPEAYDRQAAGQPAVSRPRSAALPGVELVLLARDGGDAGDDSSDCDYTYRLMDLGQTQLVHADGTDAEELTPQRPRYAKCQYVSGGSTASPGYGLATIVDGQWVLLLAIGEIEATNEECG